MATTASPLTSPPPAKRARTFPPSPPPSWGIDAARYPHIANAILDLALGGLRVSDDTGCPLVGYHYPDDRDAFAAALVLRQTCHAWAEHVDAALVRHLVVGGGRFTRPGGARLPGIFPCGSDGDGGGARSPSRALHALRHTRVLDLSQQYRGDKDAAVVGKIVPFLRPEQLVVRSMISEYTEGEPVVRCPVPGCAEFSVSTGWVGDDVSVALDLAVVAPRARRVDLTLEFGVCDLAEQRVVLTGASAETRELNLRPSVLSGHPEELYCSEPRDGSGTGLGVLDGFVTVLAARAGSLRLMVGDCRCVPAAVWGFPDEDDSEDGHYDGGGNNNVNFCSGNGNGNGNGEDDNSDNESDEGFTAARPRQLKRRIVDALCAAAPTAERAAFDNAVTVLRDEGPE